MSKVSELILAAPRPTSVAGLETTVVSSLRSTREAYPDALIWLLSGKVSPNEGSPNPLRERGRNEASLRRTLRRLQQQADADPGKNFIYFSSAEFMDGLRESMHDLATNLHQLRPAWRRIVGSGFVDGVHAADGAQDSPGAFIEHEEAVRLGLLRAYEPPLTPAHFTRRVLA